MLACLPCDAVPETERGKRTRERNERNGTIPSRNKTPTGVLSSDLRVNGFGSIARKCGHMIGRCEKESSDVVTPEDSMSSTEDIPYTVARHTAKE